MHKHIGHIPQNAQVSTHPKVTRVTSIFGIHSATCPDASKKLQFRKVATFRSNQKNRNWQTNFGHMTQSHSRRVVPHRIQGHREPNGVRPTCFPNCPTQRTCHSAQNRNRATQNSRSFRGRFHGHAHGPRLCRTNSIFASGATVPAKCLPIFDIIPH